MPYTRSWISLVTGGTAIDPKQTDRLVPVMCRGSRCDTYQIEPNQQIGDMW